MEVQAKIAERIAVFNKKYLEKKNCRYCPNIKGKFIYLMRSLPNNSWEPVCRLTYNGDLENMDFAIYKYSTEKYDPTECFFDGVDRVDGTLEGAMKAGLEAYPI